MNEKEQVQSIWNFAKIANRISFLATTERPFYVKRAVAKLALDILHEEQMKLLKRQ